jgi:hypothetical protein
MIAFASPSDPGFFRGPMMPDTRLPFIGRRDKDNISWLA